MLDLVQLKQCMDSRDIRQHNDVLQLVYVDLRIVDSRRKENEWEKSSSLVLARRPFIYIYNLRYFIEFNPSSHAPCVP